MALHRFFRRRSSDADRADELQAHLEMRVDELVGRGLSRDEAARQARLEFGNPRAALEAVGDVHRLPIFDWLSRDVRFAFRVLRRTPAFTLTAVATLALVIGAATAVFSLADAILLRPLPFPEPDRLALLERTTTGPSGVSAATAVDGATWETVRDRARTVEVAALSLLGGANLVADATAAFVRQHRVSAGFFHVLGVSPWRGREFSASEDLPNGAAVTILSHEAWRRFFHGNPDVIGRAITLRGEPHVVVGVMPEEFRSPWDADVWTPLRAARTGEGGGTNYQVIARLRPDADWGTAHAELAALSAPAFEQLQFGEGFTSVLGARSLQASLVESVREAIVLLAWAVGAVLLIACVNLAALLLSRGGARAREIATRMALGSGRWAVVRQLLVESAVLALLGGVLGLLIGYLGLRGLAVVGAGTYSEWARVSLDGRAVVAAFGLSLLTSLLFGLAPALQAGRFDVRHALADGGTRGVAGGRSAWPRRALVIAEVALGVVLLISAGLLLRTFLNLQHVDPGFRADGLVTASVSLQDARYRDAAQVRRLFDDSLRYLHETPGVEAATVSLGLPYERLLNRGFVFTDEADADGAITNSIYATPGILDTFGISLRRGRPLRDTDVDGAPQVVLVNEAFARLRSPSREVLGRRLRLGGVEREIVGVVGDVQMRRSFGGAGIEIGPITSLPLVIEPAAQTNAATLQIAHTWFSPVWTVRARTFGDGARAIERAISRADPLLPLSGTRAMTDVMASATARERLLATLVGVLAAAALLLAAVGIHGLIAHSLIERRREFGIRMALGATPGGTLARVAAGGVALAGVGALLGGVLSIPAVSLVSAVLWRVAPHDLTTWLGAAGFLFVVASFASVVPALRILRLDPAQTLR